MGCDAGVRGGTGGGVASWRGAEVCDADSGSGGAVASVGVDGCELTDSELLSLLERCYVNSNHHNIN